MCFIGAFSFGGAERVMCRLANTFAEKYNDEVILVAVSKHEKTYDISPKVKVINGIPRKNELDAVIKIRRILRIYQPDVVLSFLTHINIAVLVASIGLKTPVVVSERNDPKSIPPEKIKRVLRSIFYPFAAGYVFQTPDAKEFFGRKIQKKAAVIPNPLFLDGVQQIPFEERRKEIVSVARFVRQKRQDLLIRVFAKLHEKYPEYTLHFYGDGEQEVCRKLVGNLDLEEYVIFHGNVRNIKEVIRYSEIFVLTSEHEGMPNALMEAMGMGLACISTDCPCGGPRMLIENEKNGLLIPVNDEKKLRESLEKLLADKELKKELAQNAEKITLAYDIDKISRQWRKYLGGKAVKK